jgi:hypothetical protein
MAAPDQVKMYKLPARYQAFGVAGGGVLVLLGIIIIATTPRAPLWGLLLLFGPLLLGGAFAVGAVTTSVTIHEQGVVIRQNLRRRFIPWQAVLDVGSHRRGNERSWCVWLHVDTGVTYMDKREQVNATRGTEQHANAIVEEMEARPLPGPPTGLRAAPGPS